MEACYHANGGRKGLVEKAAGYNLACLHTVQAKKDTSKEVIELVLRDGAAARGCRMGEAAEEHRSVGPETSIPTGGRRVQ